MTVKTISCFLLLCLSLTSINFAQAQTFPTKKKSVLVCGDTKVHLVDYELSKDTIPHIIWTWDARHIEDLPTEYRNRKFNSTDDVKVVNKGKHLLISSSSGAIAMWDLQKNKTLFYAEVPNAHSIELLPGNLLVAAASTHANGNKIMLFDLKKGNNAIYTDSLYSAHGVVWHPKRKTLFTLGYDVLREYKLQPDKTLHKINEWKIAGKSGHDLFPLPDYSGFYITEHTGTWIFDLKTAQFSKIKNFPDAENIKSIGKTTYGQYVFTVPEQSWWTYHVSFSDPARSLAFPGMKVYKARWYKE